LRHAHDKLATPNWLARDLVTGRRGRHWSHRAQPVRAL